MVRLGVDRLLTVPDDTGQVKSARMNCEQLTRTNRPRRHPRAGRQMVLLVRPGMNAPGLVFIVPPGTNVRPGGCTVNRSIDTVFDTLDLPGDGLAQAPEPAPRRTTGDDDR